jgi:hypothetical protein
MEEQTTTPETSPRWLTAGADALAASSRQARRIRGSMPPAIVPNKTTPIKLAPTVKATLAKC